MWTTSTKFLEWMGFGELQSVRFTPQRNSDDLLFSSPFFLGGGVFSFCPLQFLYSAKRTTHHFCRHIGSTLKSKVSSYFFSYILSMERRRDRCLPKSNTVDFSSTTKSPFLHQKIVLFCVVTAAKPVWMLQINSHAEPTGGLFLLQLNCMVKQSQTDHPKHLIAINKGLKRTIAAIAIGCLGGLFANCSRTDPYPSLIGVGWFLSPWHRCRGFQALCSHLPGGCLTSK